MENGHGKKFVCEKTNEKSKKRFFCRLTVSYSYQYEYHFYTSRANMAGN